MAIRVEIQNEAVILGHQARVLIFEDDKLVAEVVAKIEPQIGADDNYYPGVTLERK